MTLVSILYAFLAVFGLSFLIFIHELGHYFMARRQGMRVEVFSIGFGKPIYSWLRDGVKWQLGWLLFGGYVKIAGMDMSDQKDQEDIYKVKDGFFGKRPLDRILVAAMGPVVNILFALLAFTGLWMLGGREKKFSEHTHKIGWIDPKSELFKKGLRPGDEVTEYNGQLFQNSKDHFIAPALSKSFIEVKGFHVNAQSKEKVPFDYIVKPYRASSSKGHDLIISGIVESANYIKYLPPSNQKSAFSLENSSLKDSGIKPGDRIVWVDGVSIYSITQLANVLNDSKVLLTVKRGQDVFLRRVPRVMVEDLKLDSEFKEELTDWQFEAGLNGFKTQKLYVIPYNMNNLGVVEAPVRFIDNEKNDELFSKTSSSILYSPLEPGDKILAVDGIPVTYSFEIIDHLQTKYVNLILQRNNNQSHLSSWKDADRLFDDQYQSKDLDQLISQIGISSPPRESGNLYLPKAVIPMKVRDLELALAKHKSLKSGNTKNSDAHLPDSLSENAQPSLSEHQANQYILGLVDVQDELVSYNPNPFELFATVFKEIWHTLKALITGSLNPKWMSGPIGIVQVVHQNSLISVKESLFWLGAISLNLGVLNLLPLPVLDGGTICFALYECITGRRLKAKTLERLIIPFAILLIGLFIYLTYHDILRLLPG